MKDFAASVARYRTRFPLPLPWQLAGARAANCAGAVVIPALAESEQLFAALQSLAANPPELLARFAVVVVVNHRADALAAEKADNRLTLARLARGAGVPATLQLAWVDAAAPGLELPAGEGVGLARKIGFDLALELLAGAPSLLIGLDADTRVQPDYLPALLRHFATHPAGGAAIPFRHRPAATAPEQAAIDRYELFLRHYVLGLRLAGSPYAYHSIGSACACTAAAYIAAGGMNRRQAAEDFYFLQQLAKTGGMATITGTVVHPSPRLSRRVPFGTGRSMVRQLEGDAAAVRFYPAAAFRLLADWLSLVEVHAGCNLAVLQRHLAHSSPLLADYLDEQGLARVWPRLCAQHRTPETFRRAFAVWFDGLRTLRLIHRYRDSGAAEIEAAEALAGLAAWAGRPMAADPAAWLEELRRMENGPDPAPEDET
jgi:hypothetical protein